MLHAVLSESQHPRIEGSEQERSRYTSFNGGFSYLEDQADFANRPAEELVAATDVGFASTGMKNIEVWSYDDTCRSVIVRGDTVIAVREG